MTSQVWLFTYGTLREAHVQRAVFGRELEGADDALDGFALGSVTITDPGVRDMSGEARHPILRRSGSSPRIAGSALALDEADLEKADRYEAANYVRVPVVLASGRHAFVYVQREGPAE